MDKVNVSNFRKDLYNIVKRTTMYNEAINITSKDGNAVLISEEDYNNLLATLEIKLNDKLNQKILEGLAMPLDECISEEEVTW
ncbi:type II toxin-antitoxin system Phd/YefM family antitoxin [Anaerococcus kampingiae]|uniref:Antitoxin n=1 Tax=Anaerococcus kampingae TaxID=3115614 RepID=A0ABW9MFW5_9FIRM